MSIPFFNGNDFVILFKKVDLLKLAKLASSTGTGPSSALQLKYTFSRFLSREISVGTFPENIWQKRWETIRGEQRESSRTTQKMQATLTITTDVHFV